MVDFTVSSDGSTVTIAQSDGSSVTLDVNGIQFGDDSSVTTGVEGIGGGMEYVGYFDSNYTIDDTDPGSGMAVINSRTSAVDAPTITLDSSVEEDGAMYQFMVASYKASDTENTDSWVLESNGASLYLLASSGNPGSVTNVKVQDADALVVFEPSLGTDGAWLVASKNAEGSGGGSTPL